MTRSQRLTFFLKSPEMARLCRSPQYGPHRRNQAISGKSGRSQHNQDLGDLIGWPALICADLATGIQHKSGLSGDSEKALFDDSRDQPNEPGLSITRTATTLRTCGASLRWVRAIIIVMAALAAHHNRRPGNSRCNPDIGKNSYSIKISVHFATQILF